MGAPAVMSPAEIYLMFLGPVLGLIAGLAIYAMARQT
jgi:hypothetical protein